MADSFFFYDLETSGVDARNARIMQFAGQRTDLDLNPIGEPYNYLIKLTEDTLPEPDAIMITGITPQQTIAEGLSEAEFIKVFDEQLNQPNTIYVGFNSVRFDDEFIRFLMYRNFYEPYGWQWQDGRSRWDILDLVRMTRALRPEGINWPFASDGKPTNRLELLTELNKLSHDDAHDALSDVRATIAVAAMIKQKQPKLFDYSLKTRNKKVVQHLVESDEMFVYVSGKYSSEFDKLAVVHSMGQHPDRGGALVYDLRHNPELYIKMSPEELVESWKYKKDSDEPRLPVKTLKFNRCPAVAPVSVLDKKSEQRLQIDIATHKLHLQILIDNADFYGRLLKALEIMDSARLPQATLVSELSNVDSRLYDGFISDADKSQSEKLRRAKPTEIDSQNYAFKDDRLNALLPLYKARNFPKSLNDEERGRWESFRVNRLNSQIAGFSSKLDALSKDPKLSKQKQYILEELRLYAESILPA